MIRVALADDHTLVRQGVRTLLGLLPDMEVVGEAEGGEAAVALVARERPDVLLLDLRMPDVDGLEVLARLGAAGDLPATVVLTTFDEDALLLEAVRRGARGYLLKDVTLERLAAAIRTVAAGGTLVQPGLTERAAKAAAAAPPEFEALALPDPLTAREVEVLRLVAGGWSNREIAEGLGLAEGTVKNHISSILSKLGVRDRTRAALRGLDLGLVQGAAPGAAG